MGGLFVSFLKSPLYILRVGDDCAKWGMCSRPLCFSRMQQHGSLAFSVQTGKIRDGGLGQGLGRETPMKLQG